MKKPRIDLFIIILAMLLAIAMALTLWFGKQGKSRHGYGERDLQPSSMIC